MIAFSSISVLGSSGMGLIQMFAALRSSPVGSVSWMMTRPLEAAMPAASRAAWLAAFAASFADWATPCAALTASCASVRAARMGPSDSSVAKSPSLPLSSANWSCAAWSAASRSATAPGMTSVSTRSRSICVCSAIDFASSTARTESWRANSASVMRSSASERVSSTWRTEISRPSSWVQKMSSSYSSTLLPEGLVLPAVALSSRALMRSTIFSSPERPMTTRFTMRVPPGSRAWNEWSRSRPLRG